MKNMISRRNFLKAAGAVSAAGVLAACGSSSSSTAASTAGSTAAGASSSAAAPAAAGKVYYLNFKPEQDEAWQNLAAEYTAETGIPVTVVTAAANQYETTLMSEMERARPPPCSRSTALSAWPTGRTTAWTCPTPSCTAS